jgi:hypothetical protein
MRAVTLVGHDSTELDYTHCQTLAGELGPIGNDSGKRGYIGHNSLATAPHHVPRGSKEP